MIKKFLYSKLHNTNKDIIVRQFSKKNNDPNKIEQTPETKSPAVNMNFAPIWFICQRFQHDYISNFYYFDCLCVEASSIGTE